MNTIRKYWSISKQQVNSLYAEEELYDRDLHCKQTPSMWPTKRIRNKMKKNTLLLSEEKKKGCTKLESMKKSNSKGRLLISRI